MKYNKTYTFYLLLFLLTIFLIFQKIMKKIFLFAALAGIVFASCQKEAPVASVQNEGQQEITFSALSKAMTKGVLGSGDSFGTTSQRTIITSGAYVSNGKVVDFLEQVSFARDGSTAIWKSTPSVYYPLGVDGDECRFLAYSETIAANAENASPARWYGSTEAEIQVSDESATNEIVYAGFKGAATKTDAAAATFEHSQALVTVALSSNKADAIKVNSIGFEDVKTSGTLLLSIDPKNTTDPNPEHATAKWLFNAGCNCKFAEMLNCHISGGYVPAGSSVSEKYIIPAATETEFTAYSTSEGLNAYLPINSGDPLILDRLFPAQKQATVTMVINYTLGEITGEAKLTVSTSVTWAAGTRYVYVVNVNPEEITIDPSTAAAAWSVSAITSTDTLK